MTTEQWLGVVIAGAGIYLIVCATWRQSFFLYRRKVERLGRFLGEPLAHRFYQVFGLACTVAGLLKAGGVWGPAQ